MQDLRIEIVGFVAAIACLGAACCGQEPPYDQRPEVQPPYYRVRHEASADDGGLIFPATYTAWIPADVPRLRGILVHQHGCGEGSCKSGLTAAFDLHWQALARKHACGLVAPVYEQPEKADCQKWCDPRNGSGAAFQKALVDLGRMAGRPELASVPWALWGHSGGGHWAGGLALIHPDRVVAAWLRSGVPLLEADPNRPNVKPHAIGDAVLGVPILCNPGTREGVTVTDGPFKGVWPATKSFFSGLRSRGGLVAVAVDPLTDHECGNQRYLAIPWLDACLAARLGAASAPGQDGDRLRPVDPDAGWLAPIDGGRAVSAADHVGDPLAAGWLPGEAVARAWMQYVKDTGVVDTTPPPAVTNVRVAGNEVTWDATADLESGLAGFVIERDGRRLAETAAGSRNPFGRPLFQGLQYSDTPVYPLVPPRFVDATASPGQIHRYRVIAKNTVGLESPPSEPAVLAARP